MLPRHYLSTKQTSGVSSKKSLNKLIEKFEDPSTSAGQAFKLRDYLLTIILINWVLGGIVCAYYVSTTEYIVMDYKLIAISIIFGIYGYAVYRSPY